jgi:hypothetical protein
LHKSDLYGHDDKDGGDEGDANAEDDEEEEFRYDWMHLAEMGPNANIVCSSDLGSRDIDRNYGWINDTQQQYTSDDIEKARDFVHEASNTDINDLENDDDSVDSKLSESRRILEFVDGFDWKFGEKVVLYRTGNVGLQAQWLEAWWPSSDNEFAFVVEDDLEVSSLYYEFVKTVIVNFYYNASNYSPSIFGVTLQRARFVPGTIFVLFTLL